MINCTDSVKIAPQRNETKLPTFGVGFALPFLFLSARFEGPFSHVMGSQFCHLRGLVSIVLLCFRGELWAPSWAENPPTWRTCPSPHVMRPLEGSLCHCFEPHTGHLLRGPIREHQDDCTLRCGRQFVVVGWKRQSGAIHICWIIMGPTPQRRCNH